MSDIQYSSTPDSEHLRERIRSAWPINLDAPRTARETWDYDREADMRQRRINRKVENAICKALEATLEKGRLIKLAQAD